MPDSELLARLVSLDLPRSDFAILGSGPLWAHGLIDQPADLDILARGAAWSRATTIAPPWRGERGDLIITVPGDRIEIFDGWRPMDWDIGAVIESAEWFFGLPFARLEYVLAFKQVLDRNKDAEHIRLIKDYFASRGIPSQ